MFPPIRLIGPPAHTPVLDPPASAVNGTFWPAGPAVLLEIRDAGTGCLIHQSRRFDMDGNLAGTLVTDEWDTVYPDGSGSQHAYHRFTGTLNGVQSTIALWIGARSDGHTFSGHWTIFDAAGGLASLRGYGTFEGDAATWRGCYRGQIGFFG